MKILAIIAMIAAAVLIEARADECAWAVVTVGSKHIGGEGKNYNEQNWGLGGEHCIGALFGVELRGAAGFFRNSNRIDSFYWGGSATLLELGSVKAGIALMRVSGYEIDAINAAFPVLSIEGRRFGLNLSWFPKTGDNASAIGAQVKWRWR